MVSYGPMKKNTAQTIVFPILDADGDLVGGASNLDSEYSLDGGNFSDCASEAQNITSGGSNTGIYSLALAQGETNGDVVCIQVKSTEGKTTALIFYTTSTTLDLMQTELNKIGTIVNTGGTATIGAVLGDFANSSLVTRVGNLQADVGDASASTKGSLYGIVGNPAANALTVTLENVHDTDLPAVKTDTGNIVTDTNELQGDWVNGGRLDLLIDGIKGKTDNLPASPSSLTADNVWDEAMEGALTAREQMNINHAVLAGKSAGGGTANITFQDAADTKPRVTATVDADGNRTAIANDGA